MFFPRVLRVFLQELASLFLAGRGPRPRISIRTRYDADGCLIDAIFCVRIPGKHRVGAHSERNSFMHRECICINKFECIGAPTLCGCSVERLMSAEFNCSKLVGRAYAQCPSVDVGHLFDIHGLANCFVWANQMSSERVKLSRDTERILLYGVQR